MPRVTAAIGFRAKTAKAIVVAIAGPPAKPTLIWRQEIALDDPSVPATAQPYHVVMEMPWADAVIAVKPIVAAIEAVAAGAIESLIQELRAAKYVVRAVGIVGSPDKPLERFGNPHIRAHAAEGMLFRRVLEKAAAAHRLTSRTYADDVARRFKPQLKRLGMQAGAPWRNDEKCAAAAALLALGGD